MLGHVPAARSFMCQERVLHGLTAVLTDGRKGRPMKVGNLNPIKQSVQRKAEAVLRSTLQSKHYDNPPQFCKRKISLAGLPRTFTLQPFRQPGTRAGDALTAASAPSAASRAVHNGRRRKRMFGPFRCRTFRWMARVAADFGLDYRVRPLGPRHRRIYKYDLNPRQIVVIAPNNVPNGVDVARSHRLTDETSESSNLPKAVRIAHGVHPFAQMHYSRGIPRSDGQQQRPGFAFPVLDKGRDKVGYVFRDMG